jgi:hypothetical protein
VSYPDRYPAAVSGLRGDPGDYEAAQLYSDTPIYCGAHDAHCRMWCPVHAAFDHCHQGASPSRRYLEQEAATSRSMPDPDEYEASVDVDFLATDERGWILSESLFDLPYLTPQQAQALIPAGYRSTPQFAAETLEARRMHWADEPDADWTETMRALRRRYVPGT